MAGFDFILNRELFTDFILPFLLVFFVLFAILDRTKLFGEGRKQTNAMVSLIVSLLFISYSYATGVVVKLMPVMVVIAVVLLVFMILFSFALTPEKAFVMPKGLKIALGIIIGIVVIVAVLWATDYLSVLTGWNWSSEVWSNILIIAIIGGAIALVLSTTKSS